MNSLRKSWAARSISWLLTVALLVPMLMLGNRSAQAQAQTAITVIVADFVNIRTKTTDAVATQARDAIYNELTASGQGRFNPIPQKELYTEARQLGIRVPSNPNQPANFSRADLTRLAKALNAEGVVTGRVNVATNKRSGQVTTVAIDTSIVDAISEKAYPINGAISRQSVTARAGEAVEEAVTRAIGDAGLDAVRQMVQRQVVTATVLNINVETVIINRGTRDGLHVGDELLVLEYQPNGSTISKGVIRVARAYATDCECDATLNNGIRPENIARALYRPNVILNIDNLDQSNERSTRVNFSTVGKTLAALGLGVLIAVAIKGGQGSLTNATAEATTQSTAPAVRIRFADTVFGQAGVLQYKIYRDPDFPFSSPGSGNNTGTGGGTGTTATVPSTPVGTSPGTQREFFDRPSPNFAFATGSFLVAQSNGGNNTGGVSSGSTTGGGGGGGGNTGASGCASGTSVLDLGFTPGRSYTYEITAIILRQIVQNDASGGGTGTGGLGGGGAGGSVGTGGGNGTGGTGTGTGGGGTGGGGGSGNSSQCIETDPIRTGVATPINPVLITTPINGATNIDLRQFSPSFGSRNGADLFQIEVSTDRTFSNPKTIFRQQIISTAATQDNVAQNLSTPINLTQAPELLSNQTFANFVGANSTTVPQLPTLYMRIGARHDEDVPGPVHFLSQNAQDRDKTFRFVYSQVVTFQPVPLPPGNPGSTSKVAGILNRSNTASRAVLPLPGSRRSLTGSHVSSPQEILSGRGRLRN